MKGSSFFKGVHLLFEDGGTALSAYLGQLPRDPGVSAWHAFYNSKPFQREQSACGMSCIFIDVAAAVEAERFIDFREGEGLRLCVEELNDFLKLFTGSGLHARPSIFRESPMTGERGHGVRGRDELAQSVDIAVSVCKSEDDRIQDSAGHKLTNFTGSDDLEAQLCEFIFQAHE